MDTCCAIVLDYFGVNKTITCLESLLDQGLDLVIVVDNSGNNLANAELKFALDNFRNKYPAFEIRLIANDYNLGFAAGVNGAIEWAEAYCPHHYYLLINNDAQAMPGMLFKLKASLHVNQKTIIAAPIIQSSSGLAQIQWYHRLTGLLLKRPVVGAFPYVTGCCLLVDKRIITSSLFDEDFFMYGEDIELCWRLHRTGWEISCISDTCVIHEGVGSSRQGEFFYEYHMVYAHFLLTKKTAIRRFEIAPIFAVKSFVLLFRVIVRSIRYKSITPLFSYFIALLNIFKSKNM